MAIHGRFTSTRGRDRGRGGPKRAAAKGPAAPLLERPAGAGALIRHRSATMLVLLLAPRYRHLAAGGCRKGRAYIPFFALRKGQHV